MTWVAGVDGCKGGWFGVFFEVKKRKLEYRRFDSLSEILRSSYAPEVVAVDISHRLTR